MVRDTRGVLNAALSCGVAAIVAGAGTDDARDTAAAADGAAEERAVAGRCSLWSRLEPLSVVIQARPLRGLAGTDDALDAAADSVVERAVEGLCSLWSLEALSVVIQARPAGWKSKTRPPCCG